MARLNRALVAAVAMLAIAGCSKKRPQTLPPAPMNDQGPAQPPAPYDRGQGGDTGGAIVPGSDADFRRSVTSNTVNFGVDMSDVDSQARVILDGQAEWLARYPNVRITLEGHCDERGTREYNLALGDRRANAAKNYLAAKGVSSARISTISYGKERPVANGSDEASWAQDRRAVTIVVN